MEFNTNKIINPKQVINIFNVLRAIGLNTSHRAAKYINKDGQILMVSDNDIIVVKDVYKRIADLYGNITPKQVKNDISYALNSRQEEKTIKNFERIFNFEYGRYCFTNKTIIEEIVRIISI